MRTGEDARGGKSNRPVINNHINGSGKGVKGRRADDDIRVRFADCDVRLGAEEASAVEFDGVEDGGFVGAKDVDFPVYGAGMVDVEEAGGGV